MPIVEIQLPQISDWDSFHDQCAKDLGFPEFYGRNINAWIDCLTYEDDGAGAVVVQTRMTWSSRTPASAAKSSSWVTTGSSLTTAVAATQRSLTLTRRRCWCWCTRR